VKGRSWEYVFFIDFGGHAEDPDVAQALSEVKGQVLFIKVLGTYPRRS
jgi:chorismate mutase/prephenate dehydratase